VENRHSGAQKRAALRRWLANRATALSRQGYVVETWRSYGGRRLGPYYRLRYREEGQERSLYLGRDAAFAEEVRGRLRDLQAPLRSKREGDKRYKRERAYLRRLKARWEEELRKIGLRLKGFEVRGPVTAALRRAFFIELMQQHPALAARATWWAGARGASLSHPTSGCPAMAASEQDQAICGKTPFRCPKKDDDRQVPWRSRFVYWAAVYVKSSKYTNCPFPSIQVVTRPKRSKRAPADFSWDARSIAADSLSSVTVIRPRPPPAAGEYSRLQWWAEPSGSSRGSLSPRALSPPPSDAR
jgi:hypothetical protein